MILPIETTDRAKMRKLLWSLAAGIVAGALGSILMLDLMESEMVGGLDRSREIAALVGLVYFITALAVGIGVVSPGFGARFLNVEDADELREQKTALVLSGLAMAGIGLALAILAFAAPVGPIPAEIALASAVILLVGAVLLGRRQQRYIDEFIRELGRLSAAVTFYLLVIFGGGWAILAHVGYLPAPSPLDWLSMFAGLLLIATFATCGHKGLLKPR